MPIYEEKLNVNYPFVGSIFLFSLAIGLVPGIILGGLWWLAALYIVLTIGIIVSFFQMKVELISHPMGTYGGWGIRRGRDGTFALTQAFVNECIKLETPEKTFVISSRTPETFCTAIKSVLSE